MFLGDCLIIVREKLINMAVCCIFLDVEGVNLFKGSLNVTDVNLWWPVDMGQVPGYLYTLIVS